MPDPFFNNLLLRSLSPTSLEKWLPKLARVPLKLKAPVETGGQPVEHIYFPENGVISVVVRAGDRSAEAGLVGKDGMSGTHLVLGDRIAPNDCMVQLAGDGHRIQTDDFIRLIAEQEDFRGNVLRYIQTFHIQVSQTGLAMRATLEQRLARWLLMVHDRATGPRLELTHEFMALMLATRRAGVTVALHELEGHALLKAERGVVTITDRLGLEELAGPFYGISEAEYRRIMRVNN